MPASANQVSSLAKSMQFAATISTGNEPRFVGSHQGDLSLVPIPTETSATSKWIRLSDLVPAEEFERLQAIAAAAPDVPDSTPPDDPVVGSLEGQLTAIHTRVAQLNAKLISSPENRRVLAEIDRLVRLYHKKLTALWDRLPRLELRCEPGDGFSIRVHFCGDSPSCPRGQECSVFTSMSNATRLISLGCARWNGYMRRDKWVSDSRSIVLTKDYREARRVSEDIFKRATACALGAAVKRTKKSPEGFIGGGGGARANVFGKIQTFKRAGKGFLRYARREPGFQSIETRRDISSTSAYCSADGRKLMQDTLDSGRASIDDLEKAEAVTVRKQSRRLAKGQIRDVRRNSQGRNLSPVEWAEIRSRLHAEEEAEPNLHPVE